MSIGIIDEMGIFLGITPASPHMEMGVHSRKGMMRSRMGRRGRGGRPALVMFGTLVEPVLCLDVSCWDAGCPVDCHVGCGGEDDIAGSAW